MVILPKPKSMRMLNFLSKIPAEILMKMTRFNEPQILAILCQAEGGVPVAELCREHDMSTGSFYKWRLKCGAMPSRAFALKDPAG